MSQFTLTAVNPQPRVWSGPHGDLYIWSVEFEGDQARGRAELKTKKPDPPATGQPFDAELIHKSGKVELKRIYSAPNGAGGGSSSPARGGWTPEKERSIVRQHSQEMAIRLVTLLHARGKIPEDAGNEFLTKYIDWFQTDAEAGGQR